MNILIATEFFPESGSGEITGGVESRAYYAAKELAKRHKVYVITSRRKDSNLFDNFSGFTVIRVGRPYPYSQSGSLGSRIRFSSAASCEARKLIKREGIDIVDGYSFFTYLVPIYATLLTKVKGFITYHEVWLGSWTKNTGTKAGILGEIAERAILAASRLLGTRFIAVSNFTKSQLVKHGVDSQKIDVIDNGVELSTYRQLKVSKAREPTICFIGRLTKQKRAEDLLRALPIVRKKVKNLRCTIVGTGPESDNLAGLAKQLRISPIVEFKGFIDSHTEVLKLLKSSTVFCSPSLVEGFGITMVEAIACGVPFVCSDIQPFMEISDHGLGGLHFRQGDSESLAKQLTTILMDQNLYRKCIQQEEKLAEKYDWEKIARQIEAAYSSNCKNPAK